MRRPFFSSTAGVERLPMSLYLRAELDRGMNFAITLQIRKPAQVHMAGMQKRKDKKMETQTLKKTIVVQGSRRKCCIFIGIKNPFNRVANKDQFTKTSKVVQGNGWNRHLSAIYAHICIRANKQGQQKTAAAIQPNNHHVRTHKYHLGETQVSVGHADLTL